MIYLCFLLATALLQSIESAENLRDFRRTLLAKSYLSTLCCDLEEVQRITTQSMPLINHISLWRRREVQELGSGQTHLTA